MTVLAVKLPYVNGDPSTSPALMDAIETRMLGLINDGSSSSKDVEPLAQQAAAYHLASGGQRIRARLAIDASLVLKLSTGDAVSIAAAAELVHNASLVHDDLQDRDLTRHGISTVWSAYGDGIAICAGDLLLSAAYCALSGLSRPHLLPTLLPLLHGRISAASTGQCADLTAETSRIFTVKEYENLAALKSGSLLALPLELALAAGGELLAMAQARRAAESFAIGYQIFDDLNDVKKDLLRRSAQPAINAVAVMQSHDSTGDAVALASQLALDHLRVSARTSLLLPKQSGRLLHQLSVELAAQINAGAP